MDELDFEPIRIASAPQETLLVFGVRALPTAIVLTKDASYDPVRDAKALLFYLSNGLDPVTFQQFCEMMATLYMHNALQNAPPMMPPMKDLKDQMQKKPKWANIKKKIKQETEEQNEDPESDE